MTAASPRPAPVTPGQRVYERRIKQVSARIGEAPEDYAPSWHKLPEDQRAEWEAAAQAAIGAAEDWTTMLIQRDEARAERDRLRIRADELSENFAVIEPKAQAAAGFLRERDEARAARDEYRDNVILHVRERDEARAKLAVQHDAMTQLRAGHAEAFAAVRYFAETWAELITALPDDYDCHMNCAEANAAADLYRALGDEGTAASILAAHAAHDTDGDQHYAGDGA